MSKILTTTRAARSTAIRFADRLNGLAGKVVEVATKFHGKQLLAAVDKAWAKADRSNKSSLILNQAAEQADDLADAHFAEASHIEFAAVEEFQLLGLYTK